MISLRPWWPDVPDPDKKSDMPTTTNPDIMAPIPDHSLHLRTRSKKATESIPVKTITEPVELNFLAKQLFDGELFAINLWASGMKRRRWGWDQCTWPRWRSCRTKPEAGKWMGWSSGCLWGLSFRSRIRHLCGLQRSRLPWIRPGRGFRPRTCHRLARMGAQKGGPHHRCLQRSFDRPTCRTEHFRIQFSWQWNFWVDHWSEFPADF